MGGPPTLCPSPEVPRTSVRVRRRTKSSTNSRNTHKNLNCFRGPVFGIAEAKGFSLLSATAKALLRQLEGHVSLMLDSLASRLIVFIIEDPLSRDSTKKQHAETIAHLTNQILTLERKWIRELKISDS